MEDYTKDSKKADAPEHWVPVGLPIEFPEKPNKNQEDFTVNEVMTWAEKIFCFTTEVKPIKASADTDAKNDYSYTVEAVRRYINRHLDNKPRQQDSKMKGRTRRYSREIVEKFFESYLIQDHFWRVSIKMNKDKLEQSEKRIQKCDKQDTGTTRSPFNKEQCLEDKANAEYNLKKAEAQLEKMFGTPEDREAYLKDCAAAFDRDNLSIYADKEYWVQEMKKKILFQYLFDSLINLNEDLLREDIKILLGVEDELHAADYEILAALRFKDLHNYYEGRIDLADFLRQLCGNAKQS